VQVAAADEDVWLVRTADAGRWRASLTSSQSPFFRSRSAHDSLAALYDHTLEELWARLGVRAERLRRPFRSEHTVTPPSVMDSLYSCCT